MSRKHSYKRYYSVVDQDEYEASRKRSGSFDQHSENEGNYAFDVFDDLTANIQHKHKNRRRRSQGDINDPACEQLMLTTDLSEPANDVIRDSKKNRLIVFPTLRACSIKKKKLPLICIAITVLCLVSFFIGKNTCKCESKEPPAVGALESFNSSTTQCLLKTAQELSIHNNDPLHNKCDKDSEFVKTYCDPNKSLHRCLQCKDDAWIPKFCFCDKSIHCKAGKDDRPRKRFCRECKGNFCPCLNGGKCTCNKNVLTATAEEIRCECLQGFTGEYCETVVKVCSRSKTKFETICNSSTTSTCTTFSSYFNQNVICSSPKDEQDLQTLKNCQHPNTISN